MDFTISKKQNELLEKIRDPNLRYILFGGAVAGGKSYISIFACIGIALQFPKSRIGIFRKNLSTIKKSSVRTFEKIADQLNLKYEFNRQELIVKFSNESEIQFIEADHTKDPDLNKLKGMELSLALLEEANEMTEEVFNLLITRIGRWNLNNCPAKIILTCNPAQNWVKTKFYDKWIEGKLKEPFAYLPALPIDNPFLSKEYLESLESLPEVEYKRYVLGSWDYSDESNQLIKYEWLKLAFESEGVKEGEKRLAVDVARFGNDKTIFAFMHGDTVYKFEEFEKQDTISIGEYILLRSREHNINMLNVIVDVVGVGGGVVDHLASKGFFVQSFNGGAQPNSKLEHWTFRNLRAECFWKLRQALEQNEIAVEYNETLKNDCLSIKYDVKDRAIQIQSKEEIKKEIGRSPDYADALSMLFYSKSKLNIDFKFK